MKALEFFREISLIPRGSGNEKGISDYLAEFGKKRGLVTKQDAVLNVIIYKPGTAGYENHAPVVLQSHMDMVCEKNSDTVHDFLKDPIVLRQEGDKIYANGTTLGADNGLGVAISLAVLDSSDIPHPPLEVVFTVEEETTMKGISNLDPSLISARRMINLDSGSDDTFHVGCAGGGRFEFNVPVVREALPSGMVTKMLTVRGLLGGHSGAEIHMGKANSNRILGRALAALADVLDIKVISVSGGLKANAIPREAEAQIALAGADVAKAEQIIADLQKDLRVEYRTPDPDITLALVQAEAAAECFNSETAQKVINTLLLLPYGVLHMSGDIPGLVETSNNPGVLQTLKEHVTIDCALRSSVPIRRQFVCRQVDALAAALGAKSTFGHSYPAWIYDPDSAMLANAVKVFEKVHGKKPGIAAIHAGLECGFMLEKFPDMDIVAFNADLQDIHTPNEHFALSSLEKVWKFTLELLKSL